MRLEYKVSQVNDQWHVRRGFTEPLQFGSFDAAVRAAENLAKNAIDRGETAVVKIGGDASSG